MISDDINQIAADAESSLRCIIYRLLERVIEQECEHGQLDFASIPNNILKELKVIKSHLKECEEADSGSDLDKWIRHKIISIVDLEMGYTIETYHQTFYKMTTDLDLTDEFSFAYDSFVRVCKKLMQNQITWHRIVALLCFGAEVAVYVIKKGGPGVESFINKVVHYVIEFVVKEEIADWISKHGGWITMINFFDSPDCPDRASHIATVWTLSETKSIEIWMRRIALVAVIAGVGFTISQKFLK